MYGKSKVKAKIKESDKKLSTQPKLKRKNSRDIIEADDRLV
jgi:hypothetical protein